MKHLNFILCVMVFTIAVFQSGIAFADCEPVQATIEPHIVQAAIME